MCLPIIISSAPQCILKNKDEKGELDIWKLSKTEQKGVPPTCLLEKVPIKDICKEIQSRLCFPTQNGFDFPTTCQDNVGYPSEYKGALEEIKIKTIQNILEW